MSYVFISHDLHVVRYLSDRIAVLYLGRLLEIGPAAAVFGGPHHPYTEALLSSVPTLNAHDSKARIRLSGDLPSAASPPSGCVFHTRCPRKLGAICEQQDPPFIEAGSADAAQPSAHRIRCHIPVDELRVLQAVSRDSAGNGCGKRRRKRRAQRITRNNAAFRPRVSTPKRFPCVFSSRASHSPIRCLSPQGFAGNGMDIAKYCPDIRNQTDRKRIGSAACDESHRGKKRYVTKRARTVSAEAQVGAHRRTGTKRQTGRQ